MLLVRMGKIEIHDCSLILKCNRICYISRMMAVRPTFVVECDHVAVT